MSYYSDPDGQLTLLELSGPGDAPIPPRRRPRPKPEADLIAIPFLYLDLSPDHVNLFGKHYWEICSPYREGKPPLNTGPAPRKPIRTFLSEILEEHPDEKYYLSETACLGILRRAEERGKPLPNGLRQAVMAQAGLAPPPQGFREMKAYHINQRDEGIALGGISGALMATSNMQMQTFITESTPIAFAANQRDEVRDLHDIAGALSAQPGMKQQTFVAGFSAGAGASAGSIGYSEIVAPTLKGSASGNCMPSVLCLNDQGGSVMDWSEDLSGTLRAQEHGHQPLVFENHGIDGRYTGPHTVSPTLSARAGTSGNNLPLVGQEMPEDPFRTLTTSEQPMAFSRQRVDKFSLDDVASTESARQYKDATDLILQPGKKNRPQLIRHLTPLECERLQGFPDCWTKKSGASDSGRYKALGNSVAIPCVEFIMRGIKTVIELEENAG